MHPALLLGDPAAAGIVVGALALILSGAAWHKFGEPQAFLSALAGYRLVPDALLGTTARIVPVLEAALALGLLLPVTRTAALAGTAVLIATYAGAMAINLLRGRSYIDCGCGGATHPLSWGLVARNALLVAVALAFAGPTAERPLDWIDGITLIAGVLAFYVAYLMADELLRQASRMARAGEADAARSSLS